MQWNYQRIKKLAKQNRGTHGGKVSDYLALAQNNDPFYMGTDGDIQQAQWFAEIWERTGYQSGAHLRRVHYWCVSQRGLLMDDGRPYQNTDLCWSRLGDCSKKARYLGLVNFADIVDNKNPEPHKYAEYAENNTPGYKIITPDLHATETELYGMFYTNVQPYHLEVWCEKSTMNDVLLPVCEQYNANLLTFEGEVSITACYEVSEQRIREADKPTRIFYISDFDPAGKSMPVAMSRKVEYMLDHFDNGNDVRIQALVLTLEQVQQYQLPRTPIKKTEKRASNFEDAFGTGAVELDALEALFPGVLGNIVDNALKPYFSVQAHNEVHTQRQALRLAIRQQIDAITARYADEIEALKPMFDELEAIQIDPAPYAVDTYEADVIEQDESWLFDSQRDYREQIEYYKTHKGQAA